MTRLSNVQKNIGAETNTSLENNPKKDAFPDKDVSASVESVTNSIKEENNVLEQNTQKVKENTQAKEQNVNVNFNKYDKRLDSYNGKIDKYKTTINIIYAKHYQEISGSKGSTFGLYARHNI